MAIRRTGPALQGVSILLEACPSCHGSPAHAWRVPLDI